jgi:HK97 family phage prohead protease
MNKTYFFQADIKSVEESDSGAVFIEGFASTPDIDRYKDIVEPKAFKDALDMFMKNPTMLRSHNPDRPVGVWLSATVSSKGLKVRGEVKEAQMKQEVKDGLWRALSIGYIPTESKLEHEDGTPFDPEKDSIWDSNLIRKITKLDLIEISIVSTPANGNALFTLAKSAKLYFNELVTKSFMNIKNNEEPGMGGEPVVEETPAPEGTEEESKPEEEEKEVEAEVTPEEVPAEKATEVSNKEAETPSDEAGVAPKEESEKTGETPVADGAEAPKGDEEAKAEDETESEPPVGSASAEAIIVDEASAKMIPNFIKSGLFVEAKDTEVGISLTKEVAELLIKMSDAYVAEFKRAEELQGKLNALPAKRALSVNGQFSEETIKSSNDEENGETAKPSAFSSAFKSLIEKAK